MTFAAYQARHNGTDFSFEGRDEATGILGVFRPGEAEPVVTAHTLEELEREARAYLGKEPDAHLYLTDGAGRVYRIMINEKYHAAVQRAERRTAISVALLVFSVTALLGASLGSLGAWALLGFVCAAALYTLLLRAGLSNEIEGAIVCEILLILALLLIPALQRVRRMAAESGAAVECAPIPVCGG
jgi:hypothetical protein